MDGGDPVQVTRSPSFAPVVSPDRKFVACLYWKDGSNVPVVALIPFEGGDPAKTYELPASTANLPTIIRWTADGGALTYIDASDGAYNIWSQPLEGGPPKRITDFKDGDQIAFYDWSMDGKRLALGATLRCRGPCLDERLPAN
jgi:Tol biopolymer transport system component